MHEFDRLQSMFDKQKAMQKRINGVDLPAIMPDRLPIFVTALVGELGEVLEAQQAWKDWRKNPPPLTASVYSKVESLLRQEGFDKVADMVAKRTQNRGDNMREEIVDAFHFLINIALVCDMDADDLWEGFSAKNAENHARQDGGY